MWQRQSYLNSEHPVRWGPTWSWHSTHTSVALETCVPGVTAEMLIHTHSNMCQILLVITTLTLSWGAFTGGTLVWDPVLKRTRPQMTALVCARQIKGFTKMCLASAGGQSDTCAPGRSQNNRCTPAAQRGEKANGATPAHTHTHLYKDFL